MPTTRMGYERIKRMHKAGDHSRCKFGCSPENPAPNHDLEFMVGQVEASRALAEKLGRDDPRVSVALDAREYLDSGPDRPETILGELACIAAMTDRLTAEEPDMIDMLQIRIARRLIEDAKAGVYHK